MAWLPGVPVCGSARHHAIVLPVQPVDFRGVQYPQLAAVARPGHAKHPPLKHGGHAGWGDRLTRGDDSRIGHASAGLLDRLRRTNKRHRHNQQNSGHQVFPPESEYTGMRLRIHENRLIPNCFRDVTTE